MRPASKDSATYSMLSWSLGDYQVLTDVRLSSRSELNEGTDSTNGGLHWWPSQDSPAADT